MAGKSEELTEEELKELYSPIYDNPALNHEIRESLLREAILHKLNMMLREYGIEEEDPKNSWLMLSYNLARVYHPGFVIIRKHRRPSGRPRRWDNQSQQQ